jgi:hypothetical protein
MWRRVLVAVLILLVVGGIATAIGVNAYHAGLVHGVAEGSRAVTPAVHWRYHPFLFFPFGFFLFPLVIFLVIWLIAGAGWRRHWGGPWHHDHGSGPWQSGEQRFEDWHRRAHEGGGSGPTSTV